MIEAKSIIPP
jgi:hypothetical protein